MLSEKSKRYWSCGGRERSPETMLISKTATSLDDCNFIGQRVLKQDWELISMGF